MYRKIGVLLWKLIRLYLQCYVEVEEEMDDNSDEEDTDKPAVPGKLKVTICT